MSVRYDDILWRARGVGLDIFGGLHPQEGDLHVPSGTQTMVLLGPHEPGFWAFCQAAPEFQDGAANPMDRWSNRVVSTIAAQFGGTALFPFYGPPYMPFLDWARRSGRAWQSPTGLLVHDTAGLMVSYRGAIALPDRLDLPVASANPCRTCEDEPCRTACPVDALTGIYETDRCHKYLDTDAGAGCMTRGCAARRVCPVSQSYGRLEVQSAFHMRHFHR